MALTDDQKAMLRLLAQREEGYEDMAALMGISVDEVRARVKEALAEVEESGASVTPAPEQKPEPVPPPPAPPQPPVSKEAPAPTPAPPVAAEPAASVPAPRSRGAKQAPRMPGLKLPKDRGALIGLGAGALAVLIFVIVLLVSGDGSSDSPTAGAGNGGSTTAAAAGEDENLTQAVLSPTDGGKGSGKALFGRFKQNVLLQVEAENLDPSPQGQAYTVWLYRSSKLALQIGAVSVGASGKIAAQFQIPAQLLGYVASGAFNQVDVSLTPTAEYKAAFAKAKSENRLPPYIGESVLRGEITGPAIEAQ